MGTERADGASYTARDHLPGFPFLRTHLFTDWRARSHPIQERRKRAGLVFALVSRAAGGAPAAHKVPPAMVGERRRCHYWAFQNAAPSVSKAEHLGAGKFAGESERHIKDERRVGWRKMVVYMASSTRRDEDDACLPVIKCALSQECDRPTSSRPNSPNAHSSRASPGRISRRAR